MTFDATRLFELLPTVYRLRDGEGVGDTKNALRALIDVVASQVAVLEEDIDQLYDDQFIETCAPWVAPYIGDLIGYRTLYGLTDKIGVGSIYDSIRDAVKAHSGSAGGVAAGGASAADGPGAAGGASATPSSP